MIKKLTFKATEKLSSHGNVRCPAERVNSHKSSDDWWINNMADNCRFIAVSIKSLQNKRYRVYSLALRNQGVRVGLGLGLVDRWSGVCGVGVCGVGGQFQR